MQVQIVEGPVRLEPVPRGRSAVSQVKLVVELKPVPDVQWLTVFYSDAMAQDFYSVRPKDFTINGPQCSCKCPEGKHERAVRILRKIIEKTNRRSEQPGPQ